MLVGSGVRAAGAAEKVYELYDRTKMPVVTTMNAVDLFQDGLKFGFIGTYGNRIANEMVRRCDLLIAVGARLGLRQIGRDPSRFAPGAHLVRADVDQCELSRTIKADEEKCLVDARTFMQNLLEEDIPDYSGWESACREARGLLGETDLVEGNRVVEAISELLPADPLIAVDVGQNQCWAAQSLSLRGRRGRILLGGGYGSMGCGLPYAIGASISSPGVAVFCIAGDGGFQMNIQELETVARERLPIKILLLNNRALGKISEVQEKSYGGRFAQTTASSGYTTPDFVAISEAYGVRASRVRASELAEYSAWFTDMEPCLLDIVMSEDTKLIPKLDFESMEEMPPLDGSLKGRIDALFGSDGGEE